MNCPSCHESIAADAWSQTPWTTVSGIDGPGDFLETASRYISCEHCGLYVVWMDRVMTIRTITGPLHGDAYRHAARYVHSLQADRLIPTPARRRKLH